MSISAGWGAVFGLLASQGLVCLIDRKEMRIGDKRQWYFTATMRIPDVKHKVRIVMIWRYRNDVEPCKILVTNRITWEVSRVVRVYRNRWTGTETFHRDGKQQLGLGDCQLRDVQGQTRHMYLVMLAYSLLMSQLRQGRACEWATPSPDDHRRSLSGDAPGELAHHAGLGDRAGDGEGATV